MTEEPKGHWEDGGKSWIADEPEFVDAQNWNAWAIGKQTPRGFKVRRVVWGRLLAREEKQPGEEIRHAAVMIKPR